MSDGILPALLVLLEVREAVGNKGVYLGERGALVVAALDGHGDQCHVGIRRLALPSVQLRVRRRRWVCVGRGRPAAK